MSLLGLLSNRGGLFVNINIEILLETLVFYKNAKRVKDSSGYRPMRVMPAGV